ncbi:MAG TPA: PA domain-containing protein [Anaeromyxobacteraceae bacterium]|nr:PA domain-containing protein [Anaeromyxobacteraceae bacterium]
MRASLPALAVALLVAALPASPLAATITIVNGNAPGVGFNDPTPATPVGGNAGTTLGAQRLIAFQRAADVWGATLDSAVEVRIFATFEPLTCTATSAVLGSAGAMSVWRDFPGAETPGTWYPAALANKLAGEDLDAAAGASTADDIRARFNVNIGQPGCLASSGWYLGLDTNHAANQINLVTVLLHEFAHGLGFQSFANVSTGALFLGLPDVYSRFYFDDTTGKYRLEMTDAERRISAINPRNVVWTGGRVTGALPGVLAAGTPLLRVAAPSPAAGDYQVGAASFGPPLGTPGVTGELVVATDASNASGASTTDACTAITNAAAVAGRIALVDRGTCGFVVKAANVQAAGAIAMVVADNVAGGPPAGLGGADPSIVIPSVRITLADGNTIKAALAAGAVVATLGLDPAVRAGADRAGHALLYTPNPVQSGSTISHWDTSTFPNQLMEPAINGDLRLAVDVPYDLTRPLLRDIGWYPDADLDRVADDGADQCLGSDLRATVVIGGVDSGVPNTFFPNGCTIADLVKRCATGAPNHGLFVSCVAGLGNQLVDMKVLTGAQKGALQSTAAKAK